MDVGQLSSSLYLKLDGEAYLAVDAIGDKVGNLGFVHVSEIVRFKWYSDLEGLYGKMISVWFNIV